MKSKILYTKLVWPSMCLMMLLQRSPVARYLNNIELLRIPRIQHIWSAVVASVSVGAYHSVTAASGDLRLVNGANDTEVNLGENLRLVIELESNEDHNPETWELLGDLPNGVTTQINNELGLFIIQGTATNAGSFPMTLQAWEKGNKGGDASPVFSFTITVLSDGPGFTQQPANQNVSWGESLNLSTITDPAAGTTYQWQRMLSSESDYSDIEGATTNALTIPRLTRSDEGMYRVIATNAGNSTTSDAASVTVSATPAQSWQETHFPDPFAIEAALDQDPDRDTLVNLLEFTFGMNPNQAEKDALVHISLETLDNVLHAVYTFPPLVSAGDSQVESEENTTLDPLNWNAQQDGVNGVRVSSTTEAYIIKVPVTGSVFNRLRISKD